MNRPARRSVWGVVLLASAWGVATSGSAAALSVQEAILRAKPAVALVSAEVRADVTKFSAPLRLDGAGQPLPDSGRDLALLRVKDGVYPALALTDRDPNLGDPVHILGFPGVVLSHELLSQSARIEASVTSGAVSGLKQDAIGQ